ncbi:MAG TPA: peptidoglycan DD-metalloendopeptidase family protein [Chitinophagales bacterium]|nr:peptidoglycan DD-metalloendopeptidase family protein [Chitinophagales bacterium]
MRLSDKNLNLLRWLPIAALVLLLLSSNTGTLLYAQKTSRTELQKKRRQLYEEMNITKDVLKSTRSEKESSLNTLILLEKKIQNRSKIIANIAEHIDLLDDRILEITFQIDSLGGALEQLQNDYAKAAQTAYLNRSDYNKLLFLFSAKSVNDAYRRLKYLDYFRQYRKNQVLQIYATNASLQAKLAELQQEKAEQNQLLANKQKERETLEVEKGSKDEMLKTLKSKEKEYEKKLNEKQKALDELNKQIQELIAKANANAAKNAEATGANKPLKIDTSPDAIKLSDEFSQNRGKLPWPVEKGVITANFGANPHPVLKNITTNNNGIDISTEPNAKVRAVFSGKVSNILFNPTFQWAVIIKHGNYFTVYTNLAEVTVEKGAEVKTKQSIGTVFYNADDNEAVVHLEVWESNTKLNPAIWIAR